MKNFNLEVGYKNGMFYIYEECGSGVEYIVNTPKEAAMYFKSYIENLAKENRDEEDYYDDDEDEDYDDEIYED